MLSPLSRGEAKIPDARDSAQASAIVWRVAGGDFAFVPVLLGAVAREQLPPWRASDTDCCRGGGVCQEGAKIPCRGPELGLPSSATYTVPKVMQRERIIETIRSHADELPRFDVQSLLLFGSVARDEAHEQSDVDLLVSFRGAATFGHYMGLKLFLEDLLGRRVDLVTKRALRHELRERVEREAIHVA